MKNKIINSFKTRGGGIGFIGGLTLLFIALKLCKVIKWSWLWVLSPLWATAGLVIILLILGIILGLFSSK